ncbi:hypothetical protein FGE12_02080 [Aggregicoccus sp. 17bor-14]|uniref:YncE family protein n=1 Tax=Myxococcaceae TaxID=31 RepID=UPI00129CBBD6|nr:MULTISPECIES: hypothetical protein [Myxococcaceae]MBF5041163.1 hypothetical protein [Simulacricoccus sp. 17bor-14]MRI86950.1 hypothetical protein [Aggregicoccus sp. 17bor-14]
MRPHFLTPALLFLATCSSELPRRNPPLDSFAYPSALVHVKVPGKDNGLLYVTSSNFDKLYDTGAVMAVDLDALSTALPAFERTDKPVVGPRDAPTPLNVGDGGRVFVQSMTGDMALWTSPSDGQSYLFVPSRSEGDLLQVVQANGTQLKCVGTDSLDCQSHAITLTTAEGVTNGQPGAPAPFGVTVGQGADSELWVTHLMSALVEKGTNRQATATTYVLRTDAQEVVKALQDPTKHGLLQLPPDQFLPLTVGASLAGAHAVALGPDYAFLSGRSVTSGQGTAGAPPFLLRAIRRTDPPLALDAGLRASYPDIEARGLALNATGTRLYLAGRATGSTLIVAHVNSTPTTLGVTVVRAIDTLPPGASAVKVISRGTPTQPRGDLVLITCSSAGVLAIYDDEVGDIVAQVPELGLQPYALAVDERIIDPLTQQKGARVYVANFADGRVSVIDIDDVDKPQGARVVARLGALQACASDNRENCLEGSP